jgi:hypothetical protein
MTYADVETAVQIQLTKAFVDADPVDLAMYRPTVAANGAGGYTTGTPVLVGTIRAHFGPRSDVNSQTDSTDGKGTGAFYVLTAMPDVVFVIGDEFDLNGRRYRITGVKEDVAYESKAEVTYLGQ